MLIIALSILSVKQNTNNIIDNGIFTFYKYHVLLFFKNFFEKILFKMPHLSDKRGLERDSIHKAYCALRSLRKFPLMVGSLSARRTALISLGL